MIDFIFLKGVFLVRSKPISTMMSVYREYTLYFLWVIPVAKWSR